jgi:cell division protein FtsL
MNALEELELRLNAGAGALSGGGFGGYEIPYEEPIVSGRQSRRSKRRQRREDAILSEAKRLSSEKKEIAFNHKLIIIAIIVVGIVLIGKAMFSAYLADIQHKINEESEAVMLIEKDIENLNLSIEKERSVPNFTADARKYKLAKPKQNSVIKMDKAEGN